MAQNQQSVPDAELVTDAKNLTVYDPHRTHEMVPDQTLNFLSYERCINCQLTTWDEAIANKCAEYWEKVARYNDDEEITG